jgi:hypothetical protein
MNNNLLQIKIKQRLNKLASFDYDNIECWQIQEAFNKAQIEWVRRQLHGNNNSRKEVPEQSITTVDDIQMLLTDQQLAITKKDLYYETELLPANYLHFVRVAANAKSSCCPERALSVYQAEEANIDIILSDKFKSPNFDWAETICTILGNKIRIYTNNEFEVTTLRLLYFRKPVDVQIAGCINISTGGTFATNQICELKDDIAEILVDEAAAILAGDLESMSQYQRELQDGIRNS